MCLFSYQLKQKKHLRKFRKCLIYGAEGQNRTADTGIFRPIFSNSKIAVISTS
ncbi:hypothetical protein D1BOALGB6SA_4177 [Olavius sp. associated proteobacterium Delta 1]|nr:hypothetical protein D1BOALGB6SA_4177 [Olavius sp. associated proteobacterium Delta 1]